MFELICKFFNISFEVDAFLWSWRDNLVCAYEYYILVYALYTGFIVHFDECAFVPYSPFDEECLLRKTAKCVLIQFYYQSAFLNPYKKWRSLEMFLTLLTHTYVVNVMKLKYFHLSHIAIFWAENYYDLIWIILHIFIWNALIMLQ